jgi:delta14-sterol reductase
VQSLIHSVWNTTLFISSLLAAGTISFGANFPVWTFITANFVQLFTANLIIAFLLACYVYIASFSIKHIDPDRRCLALGGNSGNVIYDWFIGRELNPRIKLPGVPEIDIKAFMEMRPGLLGWIVFDCAFMAAQYRNFGYVTDSMLITVIAQSCYVLDGFYMEPAILTTMDITTDGFGFMLSFGDVCWVPFVYSLQAHYLSTYPVHLGPYMLVTFAILGTGYYIFRSSNNEKNRFRTNPDDPAIAHLKYMDTKAGSKLLVSGWWGRARHINYIGDWTLSWSYCLPTGIAGYQIVRHSIMPLSIPEGGYRMAGHADALTVVYPGEAKGWGMIITYFFMVYFAVLLIHRERRDEAKCKSKYGSDWDEYKRRVPWRIIPYVY